MELAIWKTDNDIILKIINNKEEIKVIKISEKSFFKMIDKFIVKGNFEETTKKRSKQRKDIAIEEIIL